MGPQILGVYWGVSIALWTWPLACTARLFLPNE